MQCLSTFLPLVLVRLALSEPGETAVGKEAPALLHQSGVLNLVRALLPTVGAACGFVAVFSTK